MATALTLTVPRIHYCAQYSRYRRVSHGGTQTKKNGYFLERGGAMLEDAFGLFLDISNI